MPYERSVDVPEAAGPTCAHLRSKGMYVRGEFDPADPGNPEIHHNCWCNLTQHLRGPDSLSVSVLECSPERSCFSATR